ncbi:hypothetical protein [Amycolatopsis sp. CA-126428]|nr:hypothetical protein [Amycolatopsis sp. CA-126428]
MPRARDITVLHGKEVSTLCLICDEGDHHNDPDNYDENGVFIGDQ